MAKGKKDINKLVPVKRWVTRGGKSYETTVYVRQGQMGNVSQRYRQTVNTSEWEKIKTVDDLKNIMAGLNKMKDPADKEIYRNEFMDFLKRSGVEWVEHEDKAINWMRCMMKAKRDIKVGYFRAEGKGKHKETRYKRLSTEQAKKEIALLKKTLTKEQIRKYAEEDPNIQWKPSDHKGIDHMRMMMAIRESLEDGTGFNVLNSASNLHNKAYFHQLQRLGVINNIGAKIAQEGADVEYDEGNECIIVSHKDSARKIQVSIDENGKLYVANKTDSGYVSVMREVPMENMVDYVYKRLGVGKKSDPPKLTNEQRKETLGRLAKTLEATPEIQTRYERINGALYVTCKGKDKLVCIVELTDEGEWVVNTHYPDGSGKIQTPQQGELVMTITKELFPERYGVAPKPQKPKYPLEATDEGRKELATAKTIKTKKTGNQVNGRDPMAVLEKAKKTGETLYISPEYPNDVPFKKGVEYPDINKCTNKYTTDMDKFNKMYEEYFKEEHKFVQAQLRRPKRFTTKEEVMKWGENLGIVIDEDLFDKVNLSFHAWTDITEVVDEIAENFPRILEPKRSPNDTGGKFEIKLSLDKGEDGTFMKANNHALWICAGTFKDWESCLKSFARCMAKGHFVYGDGTFKQLVRHEFGHVLEYSLYTDEFGATEGKPNRRGSIPLHGLDWRLCADWENDVKKMRRRRGKNAGKSAYGMTNLRETIAESFASWTSQKGDKRADKTNWSNDIEELFVKWGLLK